MKTFNIDKFYIEVHVEEKKNNGSSRTSFEYNSIIVVIYYKFLGINIKIYEININRRRHFSIDDYEFDRTSLYNIIPVYIDDINTYKRNTMINHNEVRIIHSKIYYNIGNIKNILNKIKNRFSFIRKPKVGKYDLGY